MIFHEEEKETICKLDDENGKPYSPVIMTFAEGDSYLCKFETDFESMNEYDDNDPRFDEFWEMWYEVVDTFVDGPNSETMTHSDGSESMGIALTYRHFPIKIETLDGRVLYSIESDLS